MPLEVMARHAVDFWLASGDLPYPDNRVGYGPDGGVVLSLKRVNREAHARLRRKLQYLVGHMGCHHLLPRHPYLGKRIPVGGTAHQCGTVRFGTDPTASVLDTTCKAHELDNLYVVDGSFFISAGAVNPGLTIIANALRVGGYLTSRLH